MAGLTLTATVQPADARVLLDLDWSGDPLVIFAGIFRVVGGVETPVRSTFPPGPGGGPYSVLSAGRMLIYDTEMPLDMPVFYVARSPDVPYSIGANDPTVVTDTFTRTVANGWGATDTGQTWTFTSGTAAERSVDGARGIITLPTGDATSRNMLVPGVDYTDTDVRVTCRVSAVPVGGSLFSTVRGRIVDASNNYRATLEFGADGLVDLLLTKLVANSSTVLTQVSNVFGFAANTDVHVRLQITGTGLRAKTWLGTAEPGPWTAEATDTAFPGPGQGGLRAQQAATVTTATPALAFDDYGAYPLNTAGTAVTVPSAGLSWLRDPLRPCNDRPIVLQVDPACPPVAGAIVFVAMAPEVYAADSAQFNVQGRRRPVVVSRIRKDLTSTLTLATVLFADRDALLTLLEPGSPLLFTAPAEFGVPPRYMDVGQVPVSRLATDHRVQWRVFDLPHVKVDAPAGPAQGVCGARWMDLCDGPYQTWDQIDAANLTGVDVLEGEAG